MELKPASPAPQPTMTPLLIVPYGIETCEVAELANIQWAFNRTLWN